jgi:hypothetical protein
VAARVAEEEVRPRRFGPKVRLRVDLHGVSTFGPGEQRSVIRWEWIEAITAAADVVVRSATTSITIPAGTFGLQPPALMARLEAARSITDRADVIGQLAGGD